MRRLLYYSAAKVVLDDAALDAILDISRRNNAKAGITGMLLYAEAAFFQVLEGPDDAIAETYARIEQDPRHGRLILALNEGVETRDFPDWSMGFKRAENLSALPDAFFQLTKSSMGAIESAGLSREVAALMRGYAIASLSRDLDL